MRRGVLAAFVSTVLIGAALAIPASPASAGPSIGALAGAGERPGATRLSFNAGDSVRAQVDVGSGNLLLTVRGIALPSVNRQVQVGAYYNSAAVGLTPVSRLGKGWGLTNTPDVRLVENGDGSVTYHAAGGLTGVFDLVAGSTTAYTPASGFKMRLVKNPGTGWTITDDASQDKLEFTTFGALASAADRNGNTTTVTASGSGTFKNIAVATPVDTDGWSHDALVTTTSGVTKVVHGDPADPLRTVRFEPVDADTMRFVDARGRVTTFDYTTAGLITRISAPGSVTTDFAYDANSRVTSVTQDESATGGPGDSITRLAYPSAAQTLLAAPDTSQSQAVSAVPHTAYTLDSTQRVLTAVDAAGRSRSQTYTANFDTATSTQGPSGTGFTRTNTWGANSGTSLTKSASPTGSSQQLGYTGTGAAQYSPTSSTDDAGNSSTYTYNGAGNQLTATDTAGEEAELTYNPDGTVHEAFAPGNGDFHTDYWYVDKRLAGITPVTYPDLGEREYSYDDLGRLETASNGRGITRSYTYNLNDQVTNVAFTGTGSGAQSTTYGYDTAGRLASRTDSTNGAATAATTWTYDQLGRLLTRQTVVAAGSGGGGGGVITYTYDKASNLASSTSTVGGTVTYAYDASGLPTSLTYPDPAAGAPGLMRFTYDDQGRRTATYLKTNATLSTWASRTRNTYDASGRVTRVQSDTGPSTSNIVDLAYCYTAGTTPGPVGSCAASTAGDRDKVQWRRDNLTGKATTYTYDTGGRLKKAQVSGGATFTYTYDANGNRLTSSNGSTSQSLTFNKANQISTTGYTYDAAGNQKNDPSTSTSAITYTGADQLKSVTKSGTVYTYLHAGVDNVELLRQTSPTGTYANTYGRTAPTGVPVVEQTSVNDGTTTKNTAVISDPVTGTPLMLRTDNGTQSMYVYDGTPGAPIALVSSASSQQLGYDYDPYGVPTITQNSGSQALPQNPYTFGGTGVKDRTTGWVHYANRYYNPTTGTWTQQDDLDAPLDPGNANRYAYVGGDPINNTDPTGLFFGEIGDFVTDVADVAGPFVAGCLGLSGAGSAILGRGAAFAISAVGTGGAALAGAAVGCAAGTAAGGAFGANNPFKKAPTQP